MKILFALHTNLQYKLNRPERDARSRVTQVTVEESITHGTVSYITGFVGVFILSPTISKCHRVILRTDGGNCYGKTRNEQHNR